MNYVSYVTYFGNEFGILFENIYQQARIDRNYIAL